MVVKGTRQCFHHFMSSFALGEIMLIDLHVVAIRESGFIVVIIALIQFLTVIQLLNIDIKRLAHFAEIKAEVVVGQNFHHTMDDTRRIKAKLVHQSGSLPRLAKTVVHANATHANGMVFSQKFRHRTT